MQTLTISAGKKYFEKTERFDSVVIEEGAILKAPWGYGVTMMVNGMPVEPKPGRYEGDIVFVVAGGYVSRIGVWGTPQTTRYRTSLFYQDGKFVPEMSALETVKGGSYASNVIENVELVNQDGGLNGIYITGNGGEYTINNLKIDYEGKGANDFAACGAGLSIYGDNKVTVNDSYFYIKGATRGAIFAGDNSTLEVNRTTIIGKSPADPAVDPNWCMSLYGTHRVTNAAHDSTCYYNDCFITSNGWGTMSVDGGRYAHLYYKNSVIMQTSYSGYGGMSIADNFNDESEYDDKPGDRCIHSFDNCQVVVGGIGLIMCTGRSSGAFINGTVVNSRRWCTETFRNDGGTLTIDDAKLYSGSSSMIVKGSTFTIDARKAEFYPGNETILQLMDNDDPGMGGPAAFRPPYDKTDVYTEGRDLFAAVPREDVWFKLADSSVKGNIFNSTTNLYPMLDDPTEADGFVPVPRGPRPMPEVDEDDPEKDLPKGGEPMAFKEFAVRACEPRTRDLQGAKNLDVDLKNVKYEGIISAAAAKYDDGVHWIDGRNRDEVCNITQWAAPVVNNGVILTLDYQTVWTVTGNSFLSKLNLMPGAQIVAPVGKKVTMFVDGVETPICRGIYQGHISLIVE